MFALVFKFDPEQPRVDAGSPEGGQWTAGPASGIKASAKLRELFGRVASPDGGFTYQPVTDQEPTRGFALSTYPQRSFAKDMKDFAFNDLVDYAVKNQDLFQRKNHFIGAWHDPESDKVFLDISVLTEDRKKAERLAKKYDQIAYFDLGAGKSVTVNRDAKSGGAVKGEADEQEATDAARAEWIESFLAEGTGGALQADDGARADGTGVEGGGAEAQEAVNFERIFKYNPDQPRADAGTPEGGQWVAGESGGEAHVVAREIYNATAKIEPFVTQLMRGIAQAPVRLAGLDFKLKSHASLENKIAERAKLHAVSPREAAKSIGDALRYTLEIPDREYVSTVQHTVDEFRKAGFKVGKFTNYWGNDASGRAPLYQGLNMNFDNGGLRVEVQFHTPSSYATKEANHKLYEDIGKDYRSGVSPAFVHVTEEKMREAQSRVGVPEGAAGLTFTLKYGTSEGAYKAWETRRGGITSAGDETGKGAPRVGSKFIVYRVGSDSGLANRNAGNANAVAEHLVRAQGFDGPAAKGAIGQTITAYEVSVDHPYAGYQTYNLYSSLGGTRRGGSVGRMAKNGSVMYSFPKSGDYSVRRLGAVSVDAVQAHLKSQYGYENFDDAGSNAGAQAIRDLLGRRVATHH